MIENDEKTFCGYVSIIGRPNVGKSTLLNCLIGQKISITARKPQTTRHQLLGILTNDDRQCIFVDTPGMRSTVKGALNKYMNRAALSSLNDVDLVLFVVDALRFKDEDRWILEQVKKIETPVILVLNKIDQVKDRGELLPFIEELSAEHKFEAIIPVSAKLADNTDGLKKDIYKFLPEGIFLFPEDMITDKNERFLTAETVREKIMRLLGQELPYGMTVTIDAFEEEEKIVRIAAIIWVDKDSHKSMVIGAKGAKLKEIGMSARKDLERNFDKKVFLQLWVKVKSGWHDDERQLSRFGYHD